MRSRAASQVRVRENFDSRDFLVQLRVFFAKATIDMKKTILGRALGIQQQARELAPKTTEKLAESIEVIPGPGIAGTAGISYDIVVKSPYGEAVEFGTVEYDVAPPIENLMEWVEKHPEFASEYSRESAAFILADLIEEHGTPEQPFLTPAVEANRPPFLDEVKASIERSARQYRKARPTKRK